jgi:hypothetical protein
MTHIGFAPPRTDEIGSADPLSWESIAAALRRHAATCAKPEATELEAFADMLDGFAALSRRPNS